MSAVEQLPGAGVVPDGRGAAGHVNGARPAVESAVLGSPQRTDYSMLDELLTDEQRMLRARVRSFMDQEIVPIINANRERAEATLTELGFDGAAL
jgi:glutaryl-CoA dehydrogenase